MTDNVQDLTLQVLRDIRDEIVSTRVELRAEIAKTNERLDVTNERLDVNNERLGQVETTLRDLAGQQVFVSKFVRSLAVRDRDLAVDVDDLRERVAALERRTG
jgi:chromosome segregation ATPase